MRIRYYEYEVFYNVCGMQLTVAACSPAVAGYRQLKPAVLGWVSWLVCRVPDFTQIDSYALTSLLYHVMLHLAL